MEGMKRGESGFWEPLATLGVPTHIVSPYSKGEERKSIEITSRSHFRHVPGDRCLVLIARTHNESMRNLRSLSNGT